MIVHLSDTNPCQYVVSFLQESGLRDDHIVKSFGRLLKRKVCERNEEAIEWPLSLEQLIQLLDKGPFPELYNDILYAL